MISGVNELLRKTEMRANIMNRICEGFLVLYVHRKAQAYYYIPQGSATAGQLCRLLLGKLPYPASGSTYSFLKRLSPLSI